MNSSDIKLKTNEKNIDISIVNKKANITYLTRNGLLEPLGQSQVMSYLRGLSNHYRITLITYEKSKDLLNTKLMDQAHIECSKHSIRWLPQRFTPTPKFIAPVLSIFKMIWLIKKESEKHEIKLIHARSYLPAFVALIINRFMGIPFIFDMRALWPEELIAAGKIGRGSLMHRVIELAEKYILARSAAVVSLTNAAVNYLKKKYLSELKNKHITVIPTCVDLKRFTPSNRKFNKINVHGCIGTILSGWFRTDLLSRWIKIAASRDGNSHFEILTFDNPIKVRNIIDPNNKLIDRLNIFSVHSEEIPSTIRDHDISIMFFTEGLSKLGSMPTRLAEALGSGIPVIVNKGVGDLDDIIKKNNIGIIVDGDSEKHMEEAFEKLQILLQDPELPNRCLNIAETVFSLDKGTMAYHKVYKEILDRKST